ncbi:MAG TPA: cysteine desulfurase [Gemmatimonadetes bacterium]|nr:cysteine desulfurase [Gemmatimonadota bacterium]
MNDEVRALFPGSCEQVYLNVAARGLVPETVREAASEYLDDCVRGTSDKDALRVRVDETRAALAALIGADADEVAITKNVSEGLNLFSASLPWREGDNVVLCPELEHPNNIYLWYNLERLRGIEVRAIPPEDGRMPVDAMVEAMDERTRVVTFPSVSFAPGFVTDVPALVAGARRVGALTLLDAAQSIGALQTDVRALGVDALAVATQKCMLALYGFGFLYVRREVAEQLIPVHVARYGIDLGDAHETAFEEGDLTYQPGARRFDIGNYNYLGATAAQVALEFIAEIGVEAIENHVCGLAARLATGLRELGLPVVGGEPGADLAHIVSVGQIGGGRYYTADDPAMNELYEHLTANRVRLAIRSGVLRFSIGVYNNDADVERVIELSRQVSEVPSRLG